MHLTDGSYVRLGTIVRCKFSFQSLYPIAYPTKIETWAGNPPRVDFDSELKAVAVDRQNSSPAFWRRVTPGLPNTPVTIAGSENGAGIENTPTEKFEKVPSSCTSFSLRRYDQSRREDRLETILTFAQIDFGDCSSYIFYQLVEAKYKGEANDVMQAMAWVKEDVRSQYFISYSRSTLTVPH